MSTAEGASEASSPEQANEQTDERVAQYLRLYSCLFQTTVDSSMFLFLMTDEQVRVNEVGICDQRTDQPFELG